MVWQRPVAEGLPNLNIPIHCCFVYMTRNRSIQIFIILYIMFIAGALWNINALLTNHSTFTFVNVQLLRKFGLCGALRTVRCRLGRLLGCSVFSDLLSHHPTPRILNPREWRWGWCNPPGFPRILLTSSLRIFSPIISGGNVSLFFNPVMLFKILWYLYGLSLFSISKLIFCLRWPFFSFLFRLVARLRWLRHLVQASSLSWRRACLKRRSRFLISRLSSDESQGLSLRALIVLVGCL